MKCRFSHPSILFDPISRFAARWITLSAIDKKRRFKAVLGGFHPRPRDRRKAATAAASGIFIAGATPQRAPNAWGTE